MSLWQRLLHRPLPQPVLQLVLQARILAERGGAEEIGVEHLLASLNTAVSEEFFGQVKSGRSMRLSKEAKRAIAAAVELAGNRDTVRVDHLRTVLE